MSSSAELGVKIGSNISNAMRGARERSQLDQILEQAIQSNDPAVQNDTIRQILRKVSPERQQAALQVIGNRMSEIQQQNQQKSFNELADTLEIQNPNSSSTKTLASIYRSNLSPDQKEKMAKNITTGSAYKAEQQNRLALDSVLKRYNSRIKEVDTELKTAFRKDRPALEAQKKALQKERDYLLNFESLNGSTPEDVQPPQQKPKQEKIKFDPKNPEHIRIFEELDQQFNGDRTQVNAALNERFTL